MDINDTTALDVVEQLKALPLYGAVTTSGGAGLMEVDDGGTESEWCIKYSDLVEIMEQ